MCYNHINSCMLFAYEIDLIKNHYGHEFSMPIIINKHIDYSRKLSYMLLLRNRI